MADNGNSNGNGSTLTAPILPTPNWSFPPVNQFTSSFNRHQNHHHQPDGPFNYAPSLLSPIDGLADISLGRRWSTTTAEVNHHQHHPQHQHHTSIEHQQRPWTAASHPSHHAAHAYPELTHSLLLPPPQTSSTLVSTSSPFNDFVSSSSSTPNTRPSTTSSLSSAPIQTPLDLNYTLDIRGIDARPSSSSQVSPLGGNSVGSGGVAASNASSFVDDSNPFYFQRQLQTLHEQEPLSASSTTSSFSAASTDIIINAGAGGSSHGRPGSMGITSHSSSNLYQPPRSAGSNHPSLGLPFPLRRVSSSAKSSSHDFSPSNAAEHGNFYDYATPPDTGTSTTSTVYFENNSGSSLSSSHHLVGSSPPSSLAYHHQQPGYPPLHQHRISISSDPYQHSSSSTSPYDPDAPRPTSSSAQSSNGPSPYSLIVPNPDPATAAARPHLCTHCQETFRRIHDAKRHAYGAMGIKNYACMGGCQMTFKRSEGRSRHWMREEVAGVGSSVPVPGVSLGPGGTPIWGGKGCEDRHALVMSGTMEEDRRLRNKARRERIIMMQAAKSAGTNGAVKMSPAAIATAQALGLTTRNPGVVKPHSPQQSSGGSPNGKSRAYAAPY